MSSEDEEPPYSEAHVESERVLDEGDEIEDSALLEDGLAHERRNERREYAHLPRAHARSCSQSKTK